MLGYEFRKGKKLEVEEFVDYTVRPCSPYRKYNAFSITFEYDIEKVTQYDTIFIVILSKLFTEKNFIPYFGTNVYGVCRIKGEIIWNIQSPREFYANATCENDDNFANVFLEQCNGNLIFYAVTYSALKCSFDYKTGKLYDCERHSYMFYKDVLKSYRPQLFELCFNHEIEKAIKHNEMFVVLLSSCYHNSGRVRNDINNNVYGVNSSGKIIWRIQDPRQLHCKFDARPTLYTSIERYDDNIFYATCFDEIQYMFDYRTGKLLGFRQLRFGMPYSDEFQNFE